MRRILFYKAAIIALIVLSAFSCEKGGERKPGYLRVDPDTAQSVAATDTRVVFTVSSDLAWEVSVTGEGFAADKITGTGNADVTVTFGENHSASQVRTGKVTFTALDENTAGGVHTVSVEIEQAKKIVTEPGYLTIRLEENDLAADTRSVTLSIETDMQWTLGINHLTPGFSTPWQINPSMSEGDGERDITLSFDINYEYDRAAEITVSAGDITRRVTLQQRGRLGGTVFPRWTELPSIDLDPNTFFYTHHTQLKDGRDARNYSIFYDRSTYTSYWVAYPMHSSYMGTGRTDKWGYDPKIPAGWQVNYSSAWGSNYYDRGHQIASADRNATVNRNSQTDMNVQTFFYTNITPQRWQLNQQKWESLESMLRTKVSGNTDTIWVVTGAMLRSEGGSEDILYLPKTNGEGVQIEVPVPNYYFKVALWHRSIAGTKQYTAVGFWMENVDTPGSVSRSDARTVREIERLTGFDFFANLPVPDQDIFETAVGDGWF